jgi:isoleucyl-tRNA synthetase
VRRNRERFWVSGETEDKTSAFLTLHRVLVELAKVAAPFTPFITEKIYQNLVYGINKNEPESVHLCDYPLVNEDEIDLKLEKEMDLAYSIVRLGRSARNAGNIKNRQPLQKMLISSNELPKYYEDIIKDELNIKEIELGAKMNDYVSFTILPNLPVLGREYGKYIPKIKEEISKHNQVDLANEILEGKNISLLIDDGTEIVLNKANLLVTMNGKEGFAFAGSGVLGVVLDTTLTEELIEEGIVRELISKIQNLRKESGFEVVDRIKIFVYGNEEVENIIKKNLKLISKTVLANEIVFENANKNYTELNINNEVVKIYLERD